MSIGEPLGDVGMHNRAICVGELYVQLFLLVILCFWGIL